MNNYRLAQLKEQNPDKEYPSSFYKIWTNEEKQQLLEELEKNIDKNIIAQNHNRSIGGINSRIEKIAFEMHTKNILPIEIMNKTRLDELILLDIIIKKENETLRKSQIKKNRETTISIDYDTNKTKNEINEINEIKEMKNEIKNLNNTIKELVEMMKAVYEFEDS